ncbi:hypothetical protein M8J77_012737 [Diaphorina citri]|nr:hypothetical protein M8J77_012737 [Diaphorina citri]
MNIKWPNSYSKEFLLDLLFLTWIMLITCESVSASPYTTYYDNNKAFTNELKVPGLFPPIFNVASKSSIVVNATCGEVGGPEVYCKLKEHRGKADTQCSVCDASSSSPGKKHSIRYALEQNNMNWWQSPTLHQGPQYEYVTITLDMKQCAIYTQSVPEIFLVQSSFLLCSWNFGEDKRSTP